MEAEAIPKTETTGEVIPRTTEEVVPRIASAPNNREEEVMTKSQYPSGTKVNPLKDPHPPKEKPTNPKYPKDPVLRTDTKIK